MVGRTERLAEYVVDACFFENDASGTTSDNTSTSGSWFDHYFATTCGAEHRVDDGAASHRDRKEVALSFLCALLNS